MVYLFKKQKQRLNPKKNSWTFLERKSVDRAKLTKQCRFISLSWKRNHELFMTNNSVTQIVRLTL